MHIVFSHFRLIVLPRFEPHSSNADRLKKGGHCHLHKFYKKISTFKWVYVLGIGFCFWLNFETSLQLTYIKSNCKSFLRNHYPLLTYE